MAAAAPAAAAPAAATIKQVRRNKAVAIMLVCVLAATVTTALESPRCSTGLAGAAASCPAATTAQQVGCRVAGR